METNKQESIGGVWVKKTSSGDKFLSISIGTQKYIAFINKYKKEEKHPDFRVFVKQDRAKQQVNNNQNDDMFL